MKYIMNYLLVFLFVISSITAQPTEHNKYKIPLIGNGWVLRDSFVEQDIITESGLTNWTNKSDKIRVYFKLTRTGKLNISLLARQSAGSSSIKLSFNGKSKLVSFENKEFKNIIVDKYDISKPGYQFIEIEGMEKNGEFFPEINDIIISGSACEGRVFYVKEDFYWGRRGPSVHLSYPVPDAAKDVEWFYNEITVPKGEDVIGSYFMANGFSHGYFGIQVNSKSERRVLFSVWSPYDTQNPKDIPEEYKIKLLKKGKDVYSGEFGNEGSGGQSYLVYNWKPDNTYRFLLKAEPVENDYTNFTAYFFVPEEKQWKLIASFSRPKTNSYLKGLYSFLENFYTETGWISRKAYYTNQWVKDISGDWYELTKARFTADATARKESRMDYSGGEEDGKFFMKNCGFFDETTKIGEYFERKSITIPPSINFSELP